MSDTLCYWGANIRIVESTSLARDGAPVEVQRTWRERLFSRPWTPWRSTKTVIPQIPMDDMINLGGGVFLMHPVTAQKLRQEMAREQFFDGDCHK